MYIKQRSFWTKISEYLLEKKITYYNIRNALPDMQKLWMLTSNSFDGLTE